MDWYRSMVKRIWWNGAENTHPCSHCEMLRWWNGTLQRIQRWNGVMMKQLYSPLTVFCFLSCSNDGVFDTAYSLHWMLYHPFRQKSYLDDVAFWLSKQAHEPLQRSFDAVSPHSFFHLYFFLLIPTTHIQHRGGGGCYRFGTFPFFAILLAVICTGNICLG